MRTADEAGTLGVLLNKLFQRTFSVAKTVRSETDIGAQHACRWPPRRCDLPSASYPSIAEQSVLFIGAGEMIELAATHFAAQHPARMTFANRTLERAQHLAERFRGRAISIELSLPSQLAVHDIIVSCTASTLPIIGKGLVEARCGRVGTGRCSSSISRCRATSRPRSARSTMCFSTRVDDLGNIAREGLDVRESAVAQAEAIIETRSAISCSGSITASSCR